MAQAAKDTAVKITDRGHRLTSDEAAFLKACLKETTGFVIVGDEGRTKKKRQGKRPA